MRNDAPTSLIVLNAGMVVLLIARDAATDEDRQLALGLIAHECGHVEINAKMAEAIPECRLGASSPDFERGLLFQIAEIAFAEYAVCLPSAPFAKRQNRQHADPVTGVMPGARTRANSAIRSYRVHHDLHRLIGEACLELVQPIKAVAYLLGGMDAEGIDWADFAEVRTVIEEAGYGELVDELHERCRVLWDTRSEWVPDTDVLAPLIGLARDVFASGGIHLRPTADGGCQIDVPFTAATMP